MTRRSGTPHENALVAKTSHACRSRRLGDFERRICLAFVPSEQLRSSEPSRLILEADLGACGWRATQSAVASERNGLIFLRL